MTITLGMYVQALNEIWEHGFNEDGSDHCHARPGDRGVVCEADDVCVTVLWDRTGTITACDWTEVRRVYSDPRSPITSGLAWRS